MPNPIDCTRAKMYRRAHWLPEELLLEIYRDVHEMCLAEVKRDLTSGYKPLCTCCITMGDHEMIDMHLGAMVGDEDIWHEAHDAENEGFHSFHMDYCAKHPTWHYTSMDLVGCEPLFREWYPHTFSWDGVGTLRAYILRYPP
jgi:hypothetical protein